jgi:phenylpyruvate tautomerase PptA (4-oxalocrotonate tautomerase family)
MVTLRAAAGPFDGGRYRSSATGPPNFGQACVPSRRQEPHYCAHVPIVDVEMVTDDELSDDLARQLADAIGQSLGSEPGRTWVRLRTLGRHRYAESGGPLPDDVAPVFITISARRHPEPDDFASVAPKLCAAVAAVTGAQAENTHVLFGQDARGRVAFGGTLVSD